MSVEFTEGYAPNWDFDLKYGNEGEHDAADLFASLQSGRLTYEVKRDRRTLDTGNLYLECMQKPSGHTEYKPSGIATSEADWLLYKVGSAYIVAPMKSVLCLVRNHYPERVGGGEAGDNPTQGVLIKIRAFLQEINESP